MNDIDRWFSEPEFAMPSTENQDWDIVLGKPDLFPRLKAYLEQAESPEAKKGIVVAALLELLEHYCPRDGRPESARFAEEIRAVIRRHASIAKLAMEDSSDAGEIVIRKISGLPIPDYFAQWDREEAKRIGGP